MGTVLLIIGIIVALIGGIGILIAAFKEGIGWGLGCLLVPLVTLIFVIMHWQDTKKPFGIAVLGNILIIAGSAMMKPE